jgi:hypothetical protein
MKTTCVCSDIVASIEERVSFTAQLLLQVQQFYRWLALLFCQSALSHLFTKAVLFNRWDVSNWWN